MKGIQFVQMKGQVIIEGDKIKNIKNLVGVLKNLTKNHWAKDHKS